MSQENVEKVRAYLATWDGEMLRPESRPFQRIFSMEVTVALYAPDAVYEDAVFSAGTPANPIGSRPGDYECVPWPERLRRRRCQQWHRRSHRRGSNGRVDRHRPSL
jgi:hypothetical protein